MFFTMAFMFFVTFVFCHFIKIENLKINLLILKMSANSDWIGNMGGEVGKEAGGTIGEDVGSHFFGSVGGEVGEEVGSYVGGKVGTFVGDEIENHI